MLRAFQGSRAREAVSRFFADTLLIQLSMVAAVAVSVLYQTARGSDANMVLTWFGQYFAVFFCLCGAISLMVFFLNTFHAQSRLFERPQTIRLILRWVGLGAVLLLAVSVVLFKSEPVGRSVILPFIVFAGFSMATSRIGKATVKRDSPAETAPLAAHPDRDKILIVGGAGYIGSLLARQLLEAGRYVRILDNLVYGDGAIRDILDHPKFDLIQGDCRNIQDVVSAVRDVGAIVHLAAIVGDPACDQDRQTALETNYAATRMLIEIAKGHGIERFLFASSCSVYGASDNLMDENSPVHPISLYAQTKVDSEKALLHAQGAAFHPTILRFGTVFGIGYRPRFDLVVNLLSAKAVQEGVITIYNGQQWRPFIHVRDTARAIVLALNAPLQVVSGKVYNVGDTSLNHTLTEVATTVEQLYPGTRTEHIDNTDRRNYRVCFDRIRRELGFQCSLSLKQGMLEIKAALEQGRVKNYEDPIYHNQRFLQACGSPAYKNELDAHVMAAFARPLSPPASSPAAASG